MHDTQQQTDLKRKTPTGAESQQEETDYNTMETPLPTQPAWRLSRSISTVPSQEQDEELIGYSDYVHPVTVAATLFIAPVGCLFEQYDMSANDDSHAGLDLCASYDALGNVASPS